MNLAVTYEGWQMECCGIPFKIGDNIEWTVEKIDNDESDLLIRDKINYVENHHPGGVDENNISLLYGKVKSIKLVYKTFKPDKRDSIVNVPDKSMIIESTKASKDNLDINEYEFCEFIVNIENAKFSTLPKKDFISIFTY